MKIGSCLQRRLAVFSIATILLASVALVNGGPIYYADTAAYLLDADSLMSLRAPFAVRPVFYGLAIWPLHWGTFFFAAILVQALVVAHISFLTAQVCGCDLRPRCFVILVLALVVLTPVSFHVSRLLPDIFVAVLILALFLLAFGTDRLSRAEVWYLLALASAAASFHLTAIPVGLALFLLSLGAALVFHRQRARPMLVLAPVVAAIVLLLGFSLAVFDRLTLTPKNPPHLLARILADGPGRAFLRQVCPQSGFTLCAYQDRLTPVEDDFLWRLLPSIPAADGYRIKAEQGAVIRRTVAMFPLQVIEHMLSNTARQLVTFKSQTQVSPAEWEEFQATETQFARSVRRSWQGRGWFDIPAVDAVNELQAWFAGFSVLAALVLTVQAARARLFHPVMLAAVVFTGLVANAFACGALGGVFPRYEGRVIWLVPLLAFIIARALRLKSTRMVGMPAAGLEPASPVTDVGF